MDKRERLTLIQLALGKVSVDFMRQSKDVVMPTEALLETASQIEEIWFQETAALESQLANANSYPHMCRMDHEEIGHRDSSEERCPMCRMRDEYESQLADRDAEIERLRADLVWAVNSGAFMSSHRTRLIAWDGDTFNDLADCDGTPESICRAVRSARTGE